MVRVLNTSGVAASAAAGLAHLALGKIGGLLLSMKEISRAVVPIVAAQTVALLVVTYWPDLSLWLPRFMR